jgi:hypothetical protein
MTRGIEQTQAVQKEVPPAEWKINWWGILGVLCMVASAFLSVTMLWEILEFLKASSILDVMPLPG